jgi:hypothetical protein
LQGGVVRITGIERASESDLRGSKYWHPSARNEPYWIVSYELTGEEPAPITSIRAVAFDTGKSPVFLVDAKGNPTFNPPFNNPSRGGQNPIAVMSRTKILLAVRPELIGFLRLSGSTLTKVTFKKIPLQPSG